MINDDLVVEEDEKYPNDDKGDETNAWKPN
jgi:hypothetical protein